MGYNQFKSLKHLPGTRDLSIFEPANLPGRGDESGVRRHF